MGDGLGLIRLALVATVSGALTGVVGAAFSMGLNQADRLRGMTIDWAQQWPTFGWLIPVAAAALLTALAQALVQRFAPHAEAAMQGAAPPAPLSLIPVSFIGGILAIGSGLAVGREGATGQIGATIGGQLASRSGFDADDVQAIQGATFGAGLGIAFNAPLGGLAYAFEGLARRFTTPVMVAALASCAAALLVKRALVGDALEFAAGSLAPPSLATVAACLAFGVVIGGLGAAYNWATLFWLDSFAALSRVPGTAQAALIGGAIGLIAWFEPFVVGDGSPIVHDVLSGHLALSLLAFTFVARWLLGPFSYAAGTPGGLFSPALITGALTGALLAEMVNRVAPALAIDPVTCAVAGMAAFVAAVVRTPLTGIALVIGTTGTVTPIVSLLAACLSATVTPYLLGSAPIFESLSRRAARSLPSATVTSLERS